jgi:hypothetical protein
MNENLQKMFVEDAPQQVDELENVRSLSNYVISLQKLEEEIIKEETLLKQKKERADKISAEVIPGIMESMKLKTLKLQDGSAIEVKDIYSASKGYQPSQKLKVEPMTLKALYRERVEAKQDLPSEHFNLFKGNKTKITRSK